MYVKEQEIILVSGKGGVGKSAVSSSIAQKRANAGKRVLLVRLCRSVEREMMKARPLSLFPGASSFEVVQWMGFGCLQDYVTHIVKSSRVSRLFFENSMVRRLLEVAPGLNELSILGKLTSGIRNIGHGLSYDTIVVDSYATGHTLSLLRVPFAMKDFFVGEEEKTIKNPMGEQSSDIINVLQNKCVFKVVVVTLPEEFPLKESSELTAELDQLKIENNVVVNRIWPSPPKILKEGLWVSHYNRQEEALGAWADKSYLKCPFVPYSQQEDLYRSFVEVLQ